jgi:DDE superfamily endonuclease
VAEALKKNKIPPETPVEIWFQDEARVGQKNGLVYQWTKTGTWPRQPKDQRYKNAYVFGAICPARNTSAAIIMPYADTYAMQIHLDEISLRVIAGSDAALLLDQAGWHTTEKLTIHSNIVLI